MPLFESGDRDHAPSAVKAVATFFAGLSDDEQARFFEEVGRIMETWEAPSYGADWQTHAIGKHMATCACISDLGRGWLRSVVISMDGELSAGRDTVPARVDTIFDIRRVG